MRAPALPLEQSSFPEEFSVELENNKNSSLNPRAPTFDPEVSCSKETLKSLSKYTDDTQTLAQPSVDRFLAACVQEPVSSIRTVKSLFECPDVDKVTLLKNKFNTGGFKIKAAGTMVNEETRPPEHVIALFVQTLEQVDFPNESADRLKQLLYDH